MQGQHAHKTVDAEMPVLAPWIPLAALILQRKKLRARGVRLSEQTTWAIRILDPFLLSSFQLLYNYF